LIITFPRRAIATVALLVSSLVLLAFASRSGEQTAGANTSVLQTAAAAQEGNPKVAWRDNYFPNTEPLGADEMRVIALGTGTPNFRHSQASASWLVELGNGDKFIFDIGTGSLANLAALEIPYSYLDKIFVSHLHVDHIGDLDAMYIGGWVSN